MNAYKSVWPAIAREEISLVIRFGLRWKRVYYTPPQKTSAHAEVLTDSEKDGDVALIN